MATNILSARLNALVAQGLVDRRASETGGHASYQLTQKGKSLRPVLGALRDWGLTNIRGTRALIAAADGSSASDAK